MMNAEQEKNLQADSELDAELARMAEDIPPMSADFHNKWTNAVREESRKTAALKNSSPKDPAVLSGWIRALSIAAVFVFLIGGTILYRNSKRSLTSFSVREEKPTAPITSAETDSAEAVMKTGKEEDTAVMEEEAGSVHNAMGGLLAEPDQEMLLMASEAVMDEIPEEYTAQNAEEAMRTQMPRATGTPAMPGSGLEASEKKPETEKEDGFLLQAAGFLSDMFSFLRAALPYLLVLAVPAGAALVIRYRKRK